MRVLPTVFFLICKVAGFALMFIHWLHSGALIDFILLMLLVILPLLRLRLPYAWVRYTFAIDSLMLALAGWWLVFCISTVAEAFNLLLQTERARWLALRDKTAERYYDLENLHSDEAAALSQVERMTAVAERTRIARDIHDTAGHEIVAAYISLQTARSMLDGQDGDALELLDAGLERLNNGAERIRDAVHNLSAVTALGVESLRDICSRFPACPVEFHAYGDTTKVPIYVWTMLEACLYESLTNTARHSAATRVEVNLDVTPHIARLCIENDGAHEAGNKSGSGLRNLGHRAAAIGGSLSVDAGEKFRVICVVPLRGN